MSLPAAPHFIVAPIERSPKISVSSASIDSFSLTLDSNVEDPFNIVPSHLLQRSSISSVDQSTTNSTISPISHRRNSFDSAAEASPKSAERLLKKHCSYDTLTTQRSQKKEFFRSVAESDGDEHSDDDPLGIRRKDIDVRSLADFFKNTGPELLGNVPQEASQSVKKKKLFSFFKKRDKGKSAVTLSRSRSSTFTYGEGSGPRRSPKDKPLKPCLKKVNFSAPEDDSNDERAAIASLSVALAAYSSKSVVQQPNQHKSPHSRIAAFHLAYGDMYVLPNGSSVKKRERSVSFASVDDLIDEQDMVMDSKAKVEEDMEKEANKIAGIVSSDEEEKVEEVEEEEEEETKEEEKSEESDSEKEMTNSEHSGTCMEADDEFSRAGSASLESTSHDTLEANESEEAESTRSRSPPPLSPPSPIRRESQHNLKEYGLMEAELIADPLSGVELPKPPRRLLSRQNSARRSVRHVQVQTDIPSRDTQTSMGSGSRASSNSSITVLANLSNMTEDSHMLLDAAEDIDQIQEAYFELEQKFRETENELKREVRRREKAEHAYRKAREKFDEVSANAYQTLKLLMEEKKRLEKDIFILRRQVNSAGYQ